LVGLSLWQVTALNEHRDDIATHLVPLASSTAVFRPVHVTSLVNANLCGSLCFLII
jgi:hypothetical protein